MLSSESTLPVYAVLIFMPTAETSRLTNRKQTDRLISVFPPMTLYASRFIMGHEVLGTIVRLGTSFAHTSENVNPRQLESTGASKGWGAPRAYLDLNIGDKVRRI